MAKDPYSSWPKSNTRYHYDAKGRLKGYSSNTPPLKHALAVIAVIVLGGMLVGGRSGNSPNPSPTNEQGKSPAAASQVTTSPDARYTENSQVPGRTDNDADHAGRPLPPDNADASQAPTAELPDGTTTAAQSSDAIGSESAHLKLVRSFFEALAVGDGTTASQLVVPEKRESGPFSPAALTLFYSSLRRPIHLDAEEFVPGTGVSVRYSYVAASGRECRASAIVYLDSPNGSTSPLIKGIHAVSGGC